VWNESREKERNIRKKKVKSFQSDTKGNFPDDSALDGSNLKTCQRAPATINWSFYSSEKNQGGGSRESCNEEENKNLLAAFILAKVETKKKEKEIDDETK